MADVWHEPKHSFGLHPLCRTSGTYETFSSLEGRYFIASYSLKLPMTKLFLSLSLISDTLTFDFLMFDLREQDCDNIRLSTYRLWASPSIFHVLPH